MNVYNKSIEIQKKNKKKFNLFFCYAYMTYYNIINKIISLKYVHVRRLKTEDTNTC